MSGPNYRRTKPLVNDSATQEGGSCAAAVIELGLHTFSQNSSRPQTSQTGYQKTSSNGGGARGRKRRADGLLPEAHLCQLLTTGGRSSLRTRLKSRHASLDTLYHPASRPPQQWSADETARMLEATNPLQHEVRGRQVLESLDPNYCLRSCVGIGINIDQRIIVSSPCLVYLLNTHLTLC